MPREISLEVALPMAAVAPYALAAMHYAEGMQGALQRGLAAALAQASGTGPLRPLLATPSGGELSFTLLLTPAQSALLRAHARRAQQSPEQAAGALLAWAAEPFEGDLRAA